MWSLLCHIWLFLLGLALALLACWICRVLGSWIARSTADDDLDAGRRARFFILGMTPLCAAALGKCAHPDRLRRLTTPCVGRLLQRFHFPESEQRPTEQIYSTWPEQARLICAGDDQALLSYQSSIRHPGFANDPVRSERERDGVLRGHALLRSDDPPAWVPCVLGFVFAIASLFAWVLASNGEKCRCDVSKSATAAAPTGPSFPWKTVVLSTDLAFDYKMYEPRSPVHRERLKSDLVALFHEFDGITIRSVDAHTDPIGGPEDNRLLALQRKATIDQLISEIVARPERPGQFLSNTYNSATKSERKDANGPSIDDRQFWQFCFETYVKNAPKAQRPLVDLSKAKNTENNVPCSRASPSDSYPACARPDIPPPNERPPRGYAQRAEGVRELTACLSPMRYVRIEFSYKRAVPSAI